MEDYIVYGGKKITLDEYLRILGPEPGASGVRLADKKPGDIVRFGKFVLTVLEQNGTECCLLLTDIYRKNVKFGDTNNFHNSDAVDVCKEFAEELEEIVGIENIVGHDVDLTALTGAKDYGITRTRASLLTIGLYQKYIDILDKCKPDTYWWLATPNATPRHNAKTWTLCVTSCGDICNRICNIDGGVRPFCILKSNILLSRED